VNLFHFSKALIHVVGFGIGHFEECECASRQVADGMVSWRLADFTLTRKMRDCVSRSGKGNDYFESCMISTGLFR
jgi:hypothetical protein